MKEKYEHRNSTNNYMIWISNIHMFKKELCNSFEFWIVFFFLELISSMLSIKLYICVCVCVCVSKYFFLFLLVQRERKKISNSIT